MLLGNLSYITTEERFYKSMAFRNNKDYFWVLKRGTRQPSEVSVPLTLSPSCIVSMVASCPPSSSSFAPQEKSSYLTFDLQELQFGSTLLLQIQVHSLVILALRIHIIPLETFVAWKTYHNSLRTRFLCYYSEARDGKK